MSRSYVLRRVLQIVPALFMLLAVTFLVIHLAPGDPAGAFAGEDASEETRQDLREQWGLDRPLLAQFLTYTGNAVRGDLGESLRYGRPVTTIIGERLPATLLLSGTALVVSLAFGIVLGKLAARRPSGLMDAGVTTTALVANAVPAFFVGQVAILVLGLNWGLFPVDGMTDPHHQYTGVKYALDVAHHLILPAMVLAISEVTLVTRLTRTGLIRQMREGYARTAEAKGLRRQDVLERHALRNAALPLITVVGSRIGFLLSGAVVVETVFSWPGMGQLLVDAVNNGDRPMALGLVLLVATSVLVVNLVTDLVYAYVDPRIRYD